MDDACDWNEWNGKLEEHLSLSLPLTLMEVHLTLSLVLTVPLP